MASIKVTRSGKVRRAKLYYLRDRKGKSARIAEKIKKKIGVDVSVKPEETKVKSGLLLGRRDGSTSATTTSKEVTAAGLHLLKTTPSAERPTLY